MARKRAMNVEVVDKEITPQSANAQSVVVTRQTDGEDDISTTERLFGDLINENKEAPIVEEKPIVQTPVEEEVKKEELPVVEEKKEEPVIEPVPASQPVKSADDSLLETRIRAKVDGKEEEVSIKELRDHYQIRKHLNMASDKVGEERRRLAEERRQLMELRLQQNSSVQPIPTPETSYQQPAGYIPQQNTENFGALNQKIQFLEAQLNQVLEGTKPVVYQSNRQRVADELKGQGFSDFLDYIPKMETHMVTLQDQNLMNFYDTPEGAKALYFQLKAHDLQTNASMPRTIQEPQREIIPSRPPITKIDGGSQPSSANNDDSQYKYRQSFKRAASLGNDKEAWNEVLRQKGLLPE
jgi:hypothetical protein